MNNRSGDQFTTAPKTVPIVVLSILALIHFQGLFAVAATPASFGDGDVLIAMVLGTSFGQMSFAAVFIAWGPGRFTWRCAALAIYATFVLASFAVFWIRLDAADIAVVLGAVMLAQFILLQSPLWLVRLVAGIQMTFADGSGKIDLPDKREIQFGIKQLLAWTFIFAVLLAMARWMIPGEDVIGLIADDFDTNAFVFATLTGSNLLVALSTVMAALTRRWIGFWLALNAGVVIGICLLENACFEWYGLGGDDEIIWILNAIQCFWVMGSVLALRFGGIRLVRQNAAANRRASAEMTH